MLISHFPPFASEKPTCIQSSLSMTLPTTLALQTCQARSSPRASALAPASAWNGSPQLPTVLC